MERDSFDRFQPRERGLFGDNEHRHDSDKVEKVNLVDLDFFLHNDNPNKKAIAVAPEFDSKFEQWVWLPRSRIEYVIISSVRNSKVIRVTLPEALAKEKGLV